MGSLIMTPFVYTVTIRDAIHKLLQKTSVLLQKTTVQMLINVKVRTYNEPRVPRIRAAIKLGKTQR